MHKINAQGGFIRLIILIVLAVLVISYFNIDIKSTVEKPQTQSNISYVKGLGVKLWTGYLSKPLLYFWNNIFIGLLWNAFIDNFNQIKKNQPATNFTPNSENSLNPMPGSMAVQKAYP